jgi:predicted metal-dependent hydrolase
MIAENLASHSLQFDQKFMLPAKHHHRADKLFLKWYREQALRILTERTLMMANRENFSFHSIRINNAKKQWGSCSRDNKLAYSWRLIMAPLSVIDYVIVHELVHTIHHNHSKRFWQKVSSIVPNHKEYRRWLRQNDHLLRI